MNAEFGSFPGNLWYNLEPVFRINLPVYFVTIVFSGRFSAHAYHLDKKIF